MRGAYCLLIDLPTDRRLRVGKLGTFSVPAGTYVYTGSAMAGVEARVRRHLREEKRKRWHIDYLLAVARVRGVVKIEATDRVECEINELAFRVPGAAVAIPGFGSSDCVCRTHLAYWGPSEVRPEFL